MTFGRLRAILYWLSWTPDLTKWKVSQLMSNKLTITYTVESWYSIKLCDICCWSQVKRRSWEWLPNPNKKKAHPCSSIDLKRKQVWGKHEILTLCRVLEDWRIFYRTSFQRSKLSLHVSKAMFQISSPFKWVNRVYCNKGNTTICDGIWAGLA
jgi:hypothetical protein